MPERLLVGQVDDVAAPGSPAAELYIRSTGFGSPAGTAAYLVVETDPIAPAGRDGRVTGRGVDVMIAHSGSCTVRITPILDFATELDPKTVVFSQPSKRTIATIKKRFARMLTWFHCRIEVVACSDKVEFLGAHLLHPPTGGANAQAADATT